MPATQAPPAVEKFQGSEKFSAVAPKVGCSVDHLHDLFNDGWLDCLHGKDGLETTVALIYAAWERRAKARQARRSGKPESTTKKAASQKSRKEIADAAAMAGFGVRAGTGEG